MNFNRLMIGIGALAILAALLPSPEPNRLLDVLCATTGGMLIGVTVGIMSSSKSS